MSRGRCNESGYYIHNMQVKACKRPFFQQHFTRMYLGTQHDRGNKPRAECGLHPDLLAASITACQKACKPCTGQLNADQMRAEHSMLVLATLGRRQAAWSRDFGGGCRGQHEHLLEPVETRAFAGRSFPLLQSLDSDRCSILERSSNRERPAAASQLKPFSSPRHRSRPTCTVLNHAFSKRRSSIDTFKTLSTGARRC